ncbi:DASH complex subunit Spc34 [Apiosordaria backusii]|uniref:DASH complex subunit SPC34 n=1 Tax=Apiosordaria backusii TaxID=314023 RepID=A0AA40AT96_9PEZI|nr:DASH complex subunit Spc34 [Apiosordaria backusii]
MSLISAHLEQISLSCQGIDSLPFPPPKIFTNALLSSPDITSLIRDTETHERALFSVPAPPPPPTHTSNPSPDQQQPSNKPSNRRHTVFNVAAGEVTTGPPPNSTSTSRRSTAVAAVLGGDLHAHLTRRQQHKEGEVDIEILLQGAEKLCGVYALPGALERIPQLRRKWEMQGHTLQYYEQKVAEQQQQLEEQMNQWDDDGDEDEEMEDADAANKRDYITEEDVRRDEEEVRALERRKRELQARLRQVEGDLGGLMDI